VSGSTGTQKQFSQTTLSPRQQNTHFHMASLPSQQKNHFDKLMDKLSKACYVIRAVKPFITQEALRMIYFFYFQTIMSRGIIF